MRSSRSILAFALAATYASPAQAAPGSLGDFRLPSAQQQPDNRQGPVAPDVPESRRLLPAPAANPTPEPAQAPPPVASPSIAPEVQVPPGETAPAAVPPTRAAAPSTKPTPAPEMAELAPDIGLPPVADTAQPVPAPADSRPAGEPRGSVWPWVLGSMALLGALGLAGLALRRRAFAHIPTKVPQIERPRLDPVPPAQAENPLPSLASEGTQTPEALHLALKPLRLSLTLLNAALSYRLEIANRGPTTLSGLTISADMIAAHASMSREEQLSGPAGGALEVERIERLEPGESRIVTGEFRLPFPEIIPIRQGNAALLLPLARFKVKVDGTAALTRTFAVGQPGTTPGAGLQPFRLDLGPHVYPRLEQRMFA